MFRKRHTKSGRPLLPESNFLGQAARQRLVDHSYNIWGMGSLGFGMLATNVVLSHGVGNVLLLPGLMSIAKDSREAVARHKGEVQTLTRLLDTRCSD